MRIAPEYLIVPALLMSSACSSDSDRSGEIDGYPPRYQLCAVDSFGVETGDSISMIGAISSICHHPNGTLVILDQPAGCLRLIPPGGEPRRALRNGSGPGELQGAQAVCALGDGRILISDYMKMNLMTYDADANYLGDYFPTSRSDPPGTLWAVDSSSIVGVDLDGMTIDGVTAGFYYCARYDSDIDVSEFYYIMNCDELGYNDGVRKFEVLEFYADRQGMVYLVTDNTLYSVDALNPDGSLAYNIELPADRNRKSAEQIATEIAEFEAFAVNDRAYPGGYQPCPYDRLISIVGVDIEGRLWIERFGSGDTYDFDVWEEGTLRYTVVLPVVDEEKLEMTFSVGEAGIVGAVTDPYDYPRVYFYEKQQIQQ